MVEEFPSNSRSRREEEPKKVRVERVTTGETVRRKKPLRKRMMENFIGGDYRTVSESVLMEILIPSARDLIVEGFQSAIERVVYGEVRSTSRRTPIRGQGPVGHVNYNTRFRREEPLRNPSVRSRAAHDFDEIVLETRVEAEEVIDKLFELLSRFEVATVADLYDMVGVTGSYTDNKYGWTDLSGAGARRIRGGGYLLELPRPDPIGQ